MASYVLALIWVIGAVLCVYVAGERGVRKTVVRNIFYALFGPLAIPFVFLMHTENSV